ncbi:hypothetical protein MC885_018606 [Smutsia gigantea]|nr:hypothetical protein MC885_018606 [Smutsia gigantea]
MAATGGAASRRGPARPCAFSIEHILSSLPERAARPPQPAGRQSPAQPGKPTATPCECCCGGGPPRGAPRSPEPAPGLGVHAGAGEGRGARLPWPLRLGPAAPLPLAAPPGDSGALAGAGGPGPQRRTRRHRTIFSEEQLQALEALFVQNQYPDVGTRERLAGRIRLREERVEVSTAGGRRGRRGLRAASLLLRESRPWPRSGPARRTEEAREWDAEPVLGRGAGGRRHAPFGVAGTGGEVRLALDFCSPDDEWGAHPCSGIWEARKSTELQTGSPGRCQAESARSPIGRPPGRNASPGTGTEQSFRLLWLKVWFKNRRAKWRHQKRASASARLLPGAKKTPKESC